MQHPAVSVTPYYPVCYLTHAQLQNPNTTHPAIKSTCTRSMMRVSEGISSTNMPVPAATAVTCRRFMKPHLEAAACRHSRAGVSTACHDPRGAAWSWTSPAHAQWQCQTTAAATNQHPTRSAEGMCTNHPTVSTRKRQRHTGTQGLHPTGRSRRHRMRCGLTK